MEFGGNKPRLENILKMSYKGGRNECFAYGVLEKTQLYDYDLKNAYTTGLATVGAPDWERVVEIDKVCVLKGYLDEEHLGKGYVVADLDFLFPNGKTKYPNLPVLMDKDLLCLPLKGSTIIGGPEISAALSRGAEITELRNAYYIPFREDDYKPFFKPIKILQEERKKHPGGTVENHVLKLILNSIYGQTASGINPKVRYNVATAKTEQGFFRSTLSCPFTASYTTSLIRGVIAEQIYKMEELGHLILSVTTDGWICDLSPDNKDILRDAGPMVNIFIQSRKNLSGDDEYLELKHTCKGIINITVRGQLRADREEGLFAIKAMTGFQSRQ